MPTPARFAIRLTHVPAVLAAALLAACGSTPSPPTVDDSQRRPINATGAIELQTCRAELQAARLLIAEVAPAACQTPTPRTHVADVADNSTAVLLFERGQARIEVDAGTAEALRTAALRTARIDVHARGDQLQDTPADTALARRRAEAAAAWLTQRLGVPAERLRVTWTGMVDASLPVDQRRRVEIEFVDRPSPVLLTRAAAPAGVAAATPASVSSPPAVVPQPSLPTPVATSSAARPQPARASVPVAAPPATRPTTPPAAATGPAAAPTPPATRADPPVALNVRHPG